MHNNLALLTLPLFLINLIDFWWFSTKAMTCHSFISHNTEFKSHVHKDLSLRKYLESISQIKSKIKKTYIYVLAVVNFGDTIVKEVAKNGAREV